MAALIDHGIKFSSDTLRADRGARSSLPGCDSRAYQSSQDADQTISSEVSRILEFSAGKEAQIEIRNYLWVLARNRPRNFRFSAVSTTTTIEDGFLESSHFDPDRYLIY